MTTKKLLKDSILYVLLGFLPIGINFILAPVYSEFITPAEYGIVALATIFQSALAVFIGLGLDGAFSRLYFDYFKKDKLINGLMSTVLISLVMISAVIGVVLYYYGDYLLGLVLSSDQFTYIKYGQLVFFTTFSTVIHAVFLSYFRNTENVKSYSIVSILFFTSSLIGILLGVVYFKAEAFGNIAGRSVGTTVVATILILGYFLRNRLIFKVSYIKKCLNYSLPLIPYLLLLMAFNNLDKYMIEQYFDLQSLGLYNFAFLLASALSIFIYSIYNALSPRIYKLLTIGNDASIELVRQISTSFHLLVLALIVGGIALIIPIIRIFISHEYYPIESYISILIMVYIFQFYYVLFTIPIFFEKKTKVLPWISLAILIVGVVSNIILIPLYGIYGVCFALICIKITQFSIALFYSLRSDRDYSFLSINKAHILTAVSLLPFIIIYLFNYNSNTIAQPILNLLPATMFILLIIPMYGKRLKLVVKTLLSGI